MVPAPVALTPDAEAPARPPASPSFASPRPAASPQFTSPEAYLHGNYEAPRPQIAPRQLFDEDAEVDLPPARDAAPARVTPDERFATSRGVGAPSVAADPRAGTTYPGSSTTIPQHASLRAAATADERFATSRGVASQPPKTVVVGTPPSSPVRPNGAASAARSPSAVEGAPLHTCDSSILNKWRLDHAREPGIAPPPPPTRTKTKTNKSQNDSRQTATFVSLDPVASKSEDQSKAFTDASWYRSTARRRNDLAEKRRTR